MSFVSYPYLIFLISGQTFEVTAALENFWELLITAIHGILPYKISGHMALNQFQTCSEVEVYQFQKFLRNKPTVNFSKFIGKRKGKKGKTYLIRVIWRLSSLEISFSPSTPSSPTPAKLGLLGWGTGGAAHRRP